VLVNGETYHIFSRSIADFIIFNEVRDYERMVRLFRYYQAEDSVMKFSVFSRLSGTQKEGFYSAFNKIAINQENLVQIVAYCLMPTHIHLVIKQLKTNGIPIFVGKILNSYTRYFNTRHKRKGPLWESKFQNVHVENDDQLLHLTRYIHLNPVTANIVDSPNSWFFSSYREFLGKTDLDMCRFEEFLDIDPRKYREFVCDRIGYQRELAKIKKLLMDT